MRPQTASLLGLAALALGGAGWLFWSGALHVDELGSASGRRGSAITAEPAGQRGGVAADGASAADGAAPRVRRVAGAASGETAAAAGGVSTADRASAAERGSTPPLTAERLERLAARGDKPALLAAFRRDRSLLRFQALRLYLEASGPDGLPALVPDLQTEADPRALRLLTTAFGAGGTAALAEDLVRAIPDASGDEARVAAAGAALDIAGRVDLPSSVRGAAALALEDASIRTPALAARASDRLSRARPDDETATAALTRLSRDPRLDEPARLVAAEHLLRRAPLAARAALRALAQGAADPNVRDVARSHLAQPPR